jgi:serine/threonine protein phosphatase PrpC
VTELGQADGEAVVTLPGAAPVTLRWAARTDVGRRRHVNEDSLLAAPPIFAVADGMGGHAAGDRASAAAVEHLAALEIGGAVVLGDLQRGLTAAADQIDELSEDLGQGAGTTVTGAALAALEGAPAVLVFNVGDSRVYLQHQGELRRVTIDHSVVQEMVDSGFLSARDAEHHPDSNVITHALGFREVPDPDVWAVSLRTGLRLLLCSDGLTKELDDEGIALRLAQSADAAQAAEGLVTQAVALGGRDNVTVVVIEVLDAPDPGDRPLVEEVRRRRPRRAPGLDDDTGPTPII